MLGETNVPFPCACEKDTGPSAIVPHWSACLLGLTRVGPEERDGPRDRTRERQPRHGHLDRHVVAPCAVALAGTVVVVRARTLVTAPQAVTGMLVAVPSTVTRHA